MLLKNERIELVLTLMFSSLHHKKANVTVSILLMNGVHFLNATQNRPKKIHTFLLLLHKVKSIPILQLIANTALHLL